MAKNFIRFAVIGLLFTTFATGCSKEDTEESLGGSNSYGTSQATSSNFYADLLSENVPFTDATNNISGYAWEWEIQRVAGQTALSHFNFIDGFLCDTDEDAGTLRDHIVGAYYSQDGGSTWNYVAVTWGTDNSTEKDGCFGGEVLKIDFGGDNIQIRLVMDAEYEVGTQYAIYKRGAGGNNNTFDPCGIIEFAAPGCPIINNEECWNGETAYAGETVGNTGKGRGCNGAWWFAFDTEEGDATQDIFAGQTTKVGTVTYNANTDEFTITLLTDVRLKDDANAVKVTHFNDMNAYCGRPTPGSANGYKGTDLTFEGNDARYYAIHLDVEIKTDCPD